MVYQPTGSMCARCYHIASLVAHHQSIEYLKEILLKIFTYVFYDHYFDTYVRFHDDISGSPAACELDTKLQAEAKGKL